MIQTNYGQAQRDFSLIRCAIEATARGIPLIPSDVIAAAQAIERIQAFLKLGGGDARP